MPGGRRYGARSGARSAIPSEEPERSAKRGHGLAELPFFAGEEGRGHLLALLFFLSLLVVTIWGTWQGVLPATDEAVLAQTAREILTTGDARTMHFDGMPVYDTPPLVPWLMSFFFLIFGVNVFAARFAFVLLSILTCYVVYLAGKRAAEYWDAAANGSAPAAETCDPGTQRPPRTHWGSLATAIGLLAATILASTPRFGRFAPHITLGLPFAFFGALALLGWLSLPDKRAGSVLWGIGIAGALLSAGGGGFLIIIGAAIASLVERNRRGLWRKPAFILATFLGVCIGGLWLFPAAAASGRGFFGNPLWTPLSEIIRPQGRPSSLLLGSLASLWLASLPWAIPATFAAGRIIFSTGNRRRCGNVHEIDEALLIFSAVIFLPLAIAGAEAASSFLPVLPFIAILCAREIARWLRRPGKDLAKRVWTVNHVMTALFCLLMLLVTATPLRLRHVSSDSIREVARMAERMTSEGTRVGNFMQPHREQCARMLFYGNRSLDESAASPSDVAALLRSDPRRVFLSSGRDFDALRRSEAFPFDIHVLYGAGDLVLFGAREPGANDVP